MATSKYLQGAQAATFARSGSVTTQYAPTQGESEWSKAFVKNDVWRFRNANGYVRTYRVSRAETLSEGGGSGKNSVCTKYLIKFFVADLVRLATFGGRTYPAVLQGTYYSIALPVPRPTYAKRVFFTKAKGLVRVEELGGTTWEWL